MRRAFSSRAACLAALVCLVMPLSACTHVLADRDWNPYVRRSDCEVREVYRSRYNDEIRWEGVLYYDAHGRHVSETKWTSEGIRTWKNSQYDARGRLIAITSHMEEPGERAPCYSLGEGAGDVGCGKPAVREIGRADLEWDSGGRLRRRHDKGDEYDAYNLRKKEYVRQRNTDYVTEYDYDDAGRLLTVSLGRSQSTIEYDAHGRPVRLVSEHRQYTSRYAITYDTDGRIASRESGPGETTLFHYDGQGRVSRREVVSNSEIKKVEIWEYGAHGFVTRSVVVKVDPGRPEVRQEEDVYFYDYDDAGRLRETRDPVNLVTYAYSGKCDEVRLGPKSPSPMEVGDCSFSPDGVRQACQ